MVTLVVPVVAVVGLTLLELYALRRGINGKGFALVAAIIGGIAGANAKELLAVLGMGG